MPSCRDGLAGGRFLVQGVENADARDLGPAGDAGQVGHLVDGHRVDDVGLDPDVAGDVAGQERPQIGCVLGLRLLQVFGHLLADAVGSRGHRAQQPAAADDGGQLPDIEGVLLQKAEDDLVAEMMLVDDARKGGQLIGLMGDVLTEDLLVTVENGDLGRGGTGVYREYEFVCHF